MVDASLQITLQIFVTSYLKALKHTHQKPRNFGERKCRFFCSIRQRIYRPTTPHFQPTKTYHNHHLSARPLKPTSSKLANRSQQASESCKPHQCCNFRPILRNGHGTRHVAKWVHVFCAATCSPEVGYPQKRGMVVGCYSTLASSPRPRVPAHATPRTV